MKSKKQYMYIHEQSTCRERVRAESTAVSGEVGLGGQFNIFRIFGDKVIL